MTKTKKVFFGVVALVMMSLPMFFAPAVTNAQFSPDPTRARELNVSRTGNANLVEVIFTVIKGLLAVTFAIAVLMFVIAGIIYLTAANSDRSDMARDILTYAIIGLVVSVLGYAIVLFLSNALTGGNTTGAGGGISISAR